jgi:hypothetical protein
MTVNGSPLPKLKIPWPGSSSSLLGQLPYRATRPAT